MEQDLPERRRIVVDGSNIATEGRSLPSLAQLDEAIRAFLEEYRGFTTSDVTVVVDASFGHRIDPSEVAGLRAGRRTRGDGRRRRRAPWAVVTGSSCASLRSRVRWSCPTTPSRNSTLNGRGCSNRGASSAASPSPVWAGSSHRGRRCGGQRADR